MKKLVALGLLAFLISACSLAPPYMRPPMVLPEHFKEAGKWIPAGSITVPSKRWWMVFEDETLNRLQEQVTVANQDLRVAFAHFQEACALAQVARSYYFPTVTAVANPDRQQTSKTIANPLAVPLYNDYLIGLDLIYEVDVWGKIRNQAYASERLVDASKYDLDAVALSLHAELASDYFTLRGDEEMQRVLDATVIAYQKALYLTRKRYEGGASPIADVDQAITQLETAKTLATDIRLKRAQLEHAIAVLVGAIPSNFAILPRKASFKTVPIAPEIASTLLERRPDVAAAEERVKAANADIGVARAAFFPTFNLISVIGFESDSLSKLFTKPSLFWSLGPSATLGLVQQAAKVTVFDGGRLLGLLKQAKASYYETIAAYRQTVLNAFRDVEDSLVEVRRLEQENRSQAIATVSARLALDQAKKRYVGGVTNYLDVVINENFALQTELSLVTIRTRRQLATVKLIKALGGGWC